MSVDAHTLIAEAGMLMAWFILALFCGLCAAVAIDEGIKRLRMLRLAVAFWRDAGLRYDWPRAWRAARRHA